MGMVIIIFSNVEHFLPLRLQFSQLLNVSCRFVFHIFTILLPWRRFPILNLAFFMKIFSVRQTVLPALLVLSPVVFAADEQTSFVKIEKCSSHRAAKLDAEFAAIFALHGKRSEERRVGKEC